MGRGARGSDRGGGGCWLASRRRIVTFRHLTRMTQEIKIRSVIRNISVSHPEACGKEVELALERLVLMTSSPGQSPALMATNGVMRGAAPCRWEPDNPTLFPLDLLRKVQKGGRGALMNLSSHFLLDSHSFCQMLKSPQCQRAGEE